MPSTEADDVHERLRRRLDEFPLKLPAAPEITAILRRMFTRQEAELLLEFTSFQKYMTVEEFAREHGRPAGDVETMFRSLARRDLIHYRKRGTREEYCLRPFVVGMFEGLFCNWRAQDPDILVPVARDLETYFTSTFFKALSSDGFKWARVIPSAIPVARLRETQPAAFDDAGSKGQALADAAAKGRDLVAYASKVLPKTMQEGGLGGVARMLQEDGPVAVETFSRVASSLFSALLSPARQASRPSAPSKQVEINVSIPVSLHVHPHEEIVTYINQATAITVGDCACRKHQAVLKTGDPGIEESPCTHPIGDTCMQLFYDDDEANEYNSLGGRLVSREEALAINERCERDGLVHTSFNAKEKIQFICNCCPCCCGILGTVTRVNQRNGAFVASNFLPFVDASGCVRCGACAKACPVNAIVVTKESFPVINQDTCIGCGLCAVACAKQAMHMVKRRSSEAALDTVDAHLKFANQKA